MLLIDLRNILLNMENLSSLSVSSQVKMKIIQSKQRDSELMAEENTPPKNSNVFARVTGLSGKLQFPTHPSKTK